MESRYITLNFFELQEFIRESQRLFIKYVYLAKVEKKNPKKFGEGYTIPHLDMWVLASAFSYSEAIILKVKGAYNSIDITFADRWHLNEEKTKAQLAYDAACIMVVNTFERWEEKLGEYFFVGRGILSLDDKQGVLSK